MERSQFGKYQVIELIGEGGFGQVFKGLDPDLKRPVAIKTCSLQQADMKERFFKEAEIAARLQHPNITTVYDFGKVDGEPYMVQEYLTGEDLDDIIARGEPLPLDSKIRILLQVAEGLRYAHSRGVIHRDVKPANMRLLEDGQLRIMDFGIARLVEETQRLTQVGMTLGTAGYLSPEQLLGLQIDHRSDIFSFGVMAYELVTYRAPFQAESISALFYSIAHEAPPPVREIWADCPPALAACLTRCLEKDREARYGDFSEVIADLRSVLAVLESGASALPAQQATELLGAAAASREPNRAAGSAPATAAAAKAEKKGGGRGRRRALLGVAAVAVLVAGFEIVRFATQGASAPADDQPLVTEVGQEEEGAGAAAASQDAVVGGQTGEEVAAADAGGAGAQVGAPSSGGAAASAVASPSGVAPSPAGATPQAARPQATPTRTETPPAEAAAPPAAVPYRGNTTLVLLWSAGGDPASATTAENAVLEELARRGMAVIEGGILGGIHADAAAMAMARGLDAGAVTELGRAYGAEIVVLGALRTEAAPSTGRFFTGRAVLDLRTYSASAAELLGAATEQVGVDGTPGKLGASLLAAEAEAAKEVGRLAAVRVARDFGNAMPRRR